MDASHFKYHANAAAEPVLAAWGITTESKPAFIGLDAANSKSDDARDGFLRDLGVRGLACPLLVISDGAARLIGVGGRTMPGATYQRSLIHRSRKESTCRRVVHCFGGEEICRLMAKRSAG
jgi:putative transposase